MKQVAISSSGEVCVLDVPIPVCEESGVLVRVSHSLISSGTELASVKTTDGTHTSNPIVKAIQNPDLAIKAVKSILRNGLKQTYEIAQGALSSFQATGYSCAGVVIQVGRKVRDIKVGDRVACAGVGYANHAEINYVPQNLAVKIPDHVSFEQACFVTLGTIAMHGVRQARVTFGENVLVVGLGLVGQLTAQILKTAGCRVVGTDLAPIRLQLASQLGCDETVSANDPLYKEKLLQFTGGIGFDAVLLTAGTKSSEPMNGAMEMCRDRARLIVVGDVGMNLERGPFFKRELEIGISRSYGPGRYDPNYEAKGIDYPIGYARWTENRNMAEVIRQIGGNQLQVKPLISAVFPISEAFQAYGRLNDKSQESIAVLLDYDNNSSASAVQIEHKFQIRSQHSRGGKLGVAVVGAGDFMKAVHLPNISKSEQAELMAVVTRSSVNAKQIAEQYKAAYCSTDYRDILQDSQVDAVILGTRHHLRKEIIMDLAEAGKHVYVEKPLALSYDDCIEIEEAVERTGILLTVGFNRRFAPCSVNAAEAVRQLKGPKMMTYRINAGPLPPSHWLLDPEEGGGRILGEAVHFFDYMKWMLGEKPVEVIARGVHSNDIRVSGNDNLAITVVYDQGSVGTILYAGMGHSGLPKERIEMFLGGAAVTIDDFQRTSHYGTGVANLELPRTDKGLDKSLESFFQAVKGQIDLNVSVHDGTLATWCAEQALLSLNRSTVTEGDENDDSFSLQQ